MPLRVPAVAAVLSAVLVMGACSGDGQASDPTTPTSDATSAPTSKDAASTLVDTGLAQFGAGDTAAAEGTFANVLALDPTNVYALYNLGLIAQQDGRDREAAGYYDLALATDSDYTPALYNRAIVQEATDVDAAIDAYRQVTELDPTFAAAFVRLGFALVHTGERQEGEKMIAKGIELDPSLAEVDAPTYGD